MASKSHSQCAQNNRANQLNPTHPTYYLSRGATPGEAAYQASHSAPVLDNHANQLNPNSEAYKSSRGEGSDGSAS